MKSEKGSHDQGNGYAGMWEKGMRKYVPFFLTRCGSFMAILALPAATGCGPTISLDANTNPSFDRCESLAEEAISLSQQLVEIADETGEVDIELSCRFLEVEIDLLDEFCIGESTLPEGVSRETILLQQEEFNCPVE